MPYSTQVEVGGLNEGGADLAPMHGGAEARLEHTSIGAGTGDVSHHVTGGSWDVTRGEEITG